MNLISVFIFTTSLQTLVGLIWDRLVGDPHNLPHPARWVGNLILWLENVMRDKCEDLQLAGYLLCLLTVFITAAAHLLFMLILLGLDILLQKALTGQVNLYGGGWQTFPWITIFGGGVICGIWFSFRSLADEAENIRQLLASGDIPKARKALSMIVGRDTENLDAGEISRAVVETIGENSVDGGIAPLFWSLLGGPVVLAVYKAASTLDSMVGYRNERYAELGKASARLDDILAYIPARLAMIMIPFAAFLAGQYWRFSWRIGLRDCRKHPSPNSAFGESLFAGALGVQLGGLSSYAGVKSDRPLLGDNLYPLDQESITKASRLLYCLCLSAIIMTIIVAIIFKP